MIFNHTPTIYALLRAQVEFWRVPNAHLGYLLGDWLTLGAILFERARQEKLKIILNPLMT